MAGGKENGERDGDGTKWDGDWGAGIKVKGEKGEEQEEEGDDGDDNFDALCRVTGSE